MAAQPYAHRYKPGGWAVMLPLVRAEQKKPRNGTGRGADREVHATRAEFSVVWSLSRDLGGVPQAGRWGWTEMVRLRSP